MDYVKNIFSCITTPVSGLMSYGKNMRSKEIPIPKVEEEIEVEEETEIEEETKCAICTNQCKMVNT